jgi:hypothetical protein
MGTTILSIMTFIMTKLSITTHSITKKNVTFSMTTLSVLLYGMSFMLLCCLSFILHVTNKPHYAECHRLALYADCYAECHMLNIVGI